VTDVTDDGSPVEVYRRLPETGEADLVDSVVAPGSSILELGSGAGRVTNELAARGYVVTAVDDSSEMLAHVHAAETVCAKIESLRLARRFDCVLLGSHFVNDPARAPILETCARHVADDGVVLIEAYPPGLEWTAGAERRLGDVVIRLVEAERTADRVRATMEYGVDGKTWRQSFEAELLDEDELASALSASGLSFTGWLDRNRGWLEARLA
jgi:SAM-dependent methyltransferase